jgi:hypothetical protein
VSSKGLHWLLEVWEKMRQFSAQPVGFFQSHRDGYRVLELSCMKNKGGCFVELADYHSGSRQGHIRIPEGKKGVGWTSFGEEVRRYFLGNGTQRVKPEKRVVAGKEAALASSGAPGNLARPSINGESRNLSGSVTIPAGSPRNGRGSVFERIDFGHQKQSRVPMNSDGPRPTRKSVFNWKPSHKTLRIIKDEGDKRTACWVNKDPMPKAQIESQASGPVTNNQNNISRGPLVVEPNWPKSGLLKSTVEVGGHLGQPSYFACLDSVPEKGEPSRSGPSQSDPTPPIEMESPQVHRLTDDRWSSLSPSSSSIGAPEPPLACLVASGIPSQLPSVSQVLPLVTQPEEATGGFSPLHCVPLQRLDPESDQQGCFATEEERSQWLDFQYRRFSKQVGASIVGFEDQCYSLLQRIDEDRKRKLQEEGPRQRSTSGKKGLRELKSLTSSVNYEGKRLCF